MEFQAIVLRGFRFSNIKNRPNIKSTVIKKLMATCSCYREIVLSVCLRIRRDTAKCMLSSFPVFRITNGAFSGLLQFIALCRERHKCVAGEGGGAGVPLTPLCKTFFTQTTYNIQVAKTRVPSV